MTDSIYDGQSPLARPFALFLMQIIIIVSFSRLVAWLLAFVRQPKVIGELVAGIILAPPSWVACRT